MSQNLRLFLAIPCPKRILDGLEENARALRPRCRRGTFSRRENFHLTLAFLGDTPEERVEEIQACMDACPAPVMEIGIGPLGRFRRNGGDILWRQIETGPELLKLQSQLSAALREAGFPLENRPFRPHMTLARRAIFQEGVRMEELSASMPELRFQAREMALISSDLRPSGPVYTTLYRVPFQN